MKSFKLTISSPNGNVWEGEAVFLSLRGVCGDLAIMADHTPFITPVKPCKVKIELQDEGEIHGSVNDGLLTVAQNCVTLLTGTFNFEKQ